jgi:hypothetical protein
LFQKYSDFSLLKWSPAWWNVSFHTRANLKYLPKHLHLGHDPWFVLTREHVESCFLFVKTQTLMFQKICRGGLANESLFAIILCFFKPLHFSLKQQFNKDNKIINSSSTLTDWGRRSSATSPHLFVQGNETQDTWVVQQLKRENPWGLFLRKVDKNYSAQKIKEWNK